MQFVASYRIAFWNFFRTFAAEFKLHTTMKKMLMMAAMMVAALTASAQNDELKNEIGVYYGFGSASNIVSSFGTAFNWDSSDKTGFWGPVGVEYYYHVTPGVAVGAMASVAGCTWSKNSDFTSTFITVMPSVKFNWLRKAHFGMYSSLSAGVMFEKSSLKADGQKQTENNTKFMGHVTALGAEFGSKLCGFTELGFGERGVLTVGIRYKF